MKFLLKSFPALLILFSFSNCANGKQHQQEPPAEIQQAYYSTWTGGVKAAPSGLNLFIPVKPGSEIVLDSVFFRGKKAALIKEDPENSLFVARFTIGSYEGRASDLIMHSDPKREYGNEIPKLPEEIPFDLAPDEAMVRYEDEGNIRFFKITGVAEKDASDVQIKRPQNIRH